MVVVLLIEGAQVPFIPFNDVVGKEKDPPEQIGAIWVNVGNVGAVTLITTWSETEGQGPDAVKVKVTLPEVIEGV